MLLIYKIKSRILSKYLSVYFLIILQGITIQILISQCYNNNKAFQSGEKLSYHVYYNLGFVNIKLADIKFWITDSYYDNKNVLILHNTTKTLPEYEWIIKVNDYYASYIDINSMGVDKHIQKTLVDKYFTDYEYNFDHLNKKIYMKIENSKTKKYDDTINMKPCLHDLLSAAYYPRNIDYSKLTVGSKIFLPVILDTLTHNIYFRYIGNENINTKNIKNMNCIKIMPMIVETSIFTAGEKMTVWLSNDKNKVPIRMESDLKIGKILVKLDKFEGLRYQIGY